MRRAAVMAEPLYVTSRSNPLLVQLRRLVQDGGAYRRSGQAWLEGEHLCTACRQHGSAVAQAVVNSDAWQLQGLRELAAWAAQVVVVPPLLFEGLSSLGSPGRIGFVVDIPAPMAIAPALASIVLDRVQDPGNVGSILRSAAAFGTTQVLALRGTVALWSPKVLRAAMGAHFGLRLVEGLNETDLADLRVPMVATLPHAGISLAHADLPAPCAWVLGHEGQGVATSLLARCALQVCIAQPGGGESLNVAAAAAVCLYEASRQLQRI